MAWGDTDHQARIAVEIERERAAEAAIVAMIEANAEAIRQMWNRGNGTGGGILEMIGEQLGLPTSTAPRTRDKDKIPNWLRKQVFERDAYRCVTCNSHKDLACDHKKPESKGGPTTLENLQTMCRSCNSRKGNRE